MRQNAIIFALLLMQNPKYNIDIIVAHQWENALNYAYLDAIYLNYPLVHNAHLCSDCGYYYEGFNLEQGSEQLLYAIEKHDKNTEEYNYNSKKVLERYSIHNPDIISKYDKLINNLFY